jgi:hypothetical protein
MDDKQSNSIVHATVTLGKSLDLPITAEGWKKRAFTSVCKILAAPMPKDGCSGGLFLVAKQERGSSILRTRHCPFYLKRIRTFRRRLIGELVAGSVAHEHVPAVAGSAEWAGLPFPCSNVRRLSPSSPGLGSSPISK